MPRPRGEVAKSLGEAGEIAAETEALLTENGCNHGEYPEDVLEKLAGDFGNGAGGGWDSADSNWRVPAEELAKRKDFRSTRIFSIDPYTARDLDDALHCTDLGGAPKLSGAGPG